MTTGAKTVPKATSKVTTNHEVIRKWVEARGGHPASVKKTAGEGPGVIRIDFPGYKGAQSLEPISWEEFFEQFEERELAFLYQDKTASDKVSRFNKIISRDTAEEASKGRRQSLQKAGR